MESSAIATFIPQKSNVFSGSSSACPEPEVMEIAPPSGDRTSRRKAKGKRKEVAYHEIIDVDLVEDNNDVVLLEGKVESRKRAKGSMGISLGSSSSAAKIDSKKVASNNKGKEILDHSSMGFNPGSNNFFDLDDYVFDDEYSTLQSCFDSIGLPAGVEAPFPWLPDLVPVKKDNPATSNAQLEAGVSQLNRVDPLSTSTKFSSSKKNTAVGTPFTCIDPVYTPPHPTYAPTYPNYAPTQPNIDPKYIPTSPGYTPTHPKYAPTQPAYANFTQTGTSSYPLAMNTAYPPGIDTSNSDWHKDIMKIQKRMYKPSSSAGMLSGTGGMYSMNDMLLGKDATVNGPSTVSLSSVKSPSRLSKFVDDDVQKRYESFKKFDTVVDCSDHYYFKQNSTKQPPKNWAKKIQDEWRILERDLPDTIFVRVYESRMDLLRAVIIGAEGTPYHDGLFFFDVCFPSSYPKSPPHVHYHSGGLHINPNLYNCGKVCLSLLNTWTGGHKEKWIPGTSTMLQVLVSIQGLILNMKPYFNEPGYAHSSGSVHGEKAALDYNENTLILSLKTMVYTMNKPPKHFEDLVIGHFQHRARDIFMACKAYTEGVQVGCLVKGGVQDLEEASKSCSPQFKHNVGSYIKTLVGAFKKIGAKEAQDFLSLTAK